MKDFAGFLLFGLAGLYLASSAHAETLNGKKLRKEVSGKTVYLSVAAGVELPIKYRSSGVMLGKLEGIISMLPTGMPSKDRGRWWIANGHLCQTWNKWLKSRRYCYRLSKVNGKVHWRRNDGRRGTARIVSK